MGNTAINEGEWSRSFRVKDCGVLVLQVLLGDAWREEAVLHNLQEPAWRNWRDGSSAGGPPGKKWGWQAWLMGFGKIAGFCPPSMSRVHKYHLIISCMGQEPKEEGKSKLNMMIDDSEFYRRGNFDQANLARPQYMSELTAGSPGSALTVVLHSLACKGKSFDKYFQTRSRRPTTKASPRMQNIGLRGRHLGVDLGAWGLGVGGCRDMATNGAREQDWPVKWIHCRCLPAKASKLSSTAASRAMRPSHLNKFVG